MAPKVLSAQLVNKGGRWETARRFNGNGNPAAAPYGVLAPWSRGPEQEGFHVVRVVGKRYDDVKKLELILQGGTE